MCSKLSLQVGTCIVYQVTIKVHYTGVPCVQLGTNLYYLCRKVHALCTKLLQYDTDVSCMQLGTDVQQTIFAGG